MKKCAPPWCHLEIEDHWLSKEENRFTHALKKESTLGTQVKRMS